MENAKMKENFIPRLYVVVCMLLTRASYNKHSYSFNNHREWSQWGIPSTSMHNKHFLPHSWECSEIKVISLSQERLPLLSCHKILQMTSLAVTRVGGFAISTFSSQSKGKELFINTIEWFVMHKWIYNCYYEVGFVI